MVSNRIRPYEPNPSSTDDLIGVRSSGPERWRDRAGSRQSGHAAAPVRPAPAALRTGKRDNYGQSSRAEFAETQRDSYTELSQFSVPLRTLAAKLILLISHRLLLQVRIGNL